MLKKDIERGKAYFNSLFGSLDDCIRDDDPRYLEYSALKEKTLNLFYLNEDFDYFTAIGKSWEMSEFLSIFGYDDFMLAVREANGGDVVCKMGASLVLKTCNVS